jgi:DNA polymerase elongation subunit (family B)
VPIEDLLVAQRLTRAPEKYKSPSPAARAAMQLQAAGKDVQAGQRMRFIYVYGRPDVWAWDRSDQFDPQRIDIRIYRKLLLRAAVDVFQPFGISLQDLTLILEGNAITFPLLVPALEMPDGKIGIYS